MITRLLKLIASASLIMSLPLEANQPTELNNKVFCEGDLDYSQLLHFNFNEPVNGVQVRAFIDSRKFNPLKAVDLQRSANCYLEPEISRTIFFKAEQTQPIQLRLGSRAVVDYIQQDFVEGDALFFAKNSHFKVTDENNEMIAGNPNYTAERLDRVTGEIIISVESRDALIYTDKGIEIPQGKVKDFTFSAKNPGLQARVFEPLEITHSELFDRKYDTIQFV